MSKTVIKIEVKKAWELPTGAREHKNTIFDSRPRRQKTRQGVDKQWKKEYDLV